MHSQDLTIRDYLRPVLRMKWVIAAIVLCVSGLAYANANSKPRIYQSSTRVLLTTESTGLRSAATVLDDRAVNNQVALLSSPAVSERVAKELGQPELARAFAGSISASGTTNADYITIQATWGDARGAARIADAFARALIDIRGQQRREGLRAAIDATQEQLDQIAPSSANLDRRQDLQDTIRGLRVDLATSSGDAVQISPASVPAAPVSPRPRRDAFLAAVIALIGSIALAYAIAAFDRRLRRPQDIAATYGLPVLAVIPDIGGTLASFDEGRAAVSRSLQEPLRHLRTNIRLASDDAPRLILVTSAVPGEGKSTVVRNLAIVFREAGARVAVVDADLRRGTLAKLFERPDSPGLTDVIVGDVHVEDALVSVPIRARGLRTITRLSAGGDGVATANDPDAEFLDLLPSGPSPADPETVLASRHVQAIVQRLLDDHDIVLLDSAPMLNVADAIPLAHLADATIVVSRVDHVTRDQAQRLKESMARLTDGSPIGVVVNAATVDGAEYGYGAA